MKQQILWITPTYPDDESSYRGRFIKDIAKRITHAAEVQIVLLTGKIFPASKGKESLNNNTAYRFPFLSEGKLLINYKTIPYFRMLSYYLMFSLYCIYIFLRYEIQLVHIHFVLPLGLPGVLLSKLFGKKVIITLHGSDILVLPKRSKIAKLFAKYALVLSDRIIAVAHHIKSECIEWGIYSDKISVVPMGIDTEKFYPYEAPKNDNKFILFSNRNLEEIYDLTTLIEAGRLLKSELTDFEILIAGLGTQKDQLMRKVLELGLQKHIKFIGHISNDEMPEYLNKCDLYVSTALSDGTSVSLLEALSCGAYALLRDIDSNRLWKDEGVQCSLFDTPEDLAKKILEIKNNPKKSEIAKKQNPDIITKKASNNVVVRTYLNLYQEEYND